MIYEKKVDGVRKLFYTESIPSDNDIEVTYKNESGESITPEDKDTYVDNNSIGNIQHIKRLSDDSTVNVYAGNKCLIGEVVSPTVHEQEEQEELEEPEE